MQREKRPGPHSEDWAALEFLEQAAKELLEQQWKKTTNGETAGGDGTPVVRAADRVVGAGRANEGTGG